MNVRDVFAALKALTADLTNDVQIEAVKRLFDVVSHMATMPDVIANGQMSWWLPDTDAVVVQLVIQPDGTYFLVDGVGVMSRTTRAFSRNESPKHMAELTEQAVASYRGGIARATLKGQKRP